MGSVEVYAQYQDLTLSFNHIKSAVIYSAYPLTDSRWVSWPRC